VLIIFELYFLSSQTKVGVSGSVGGAGGATGSVGSAGGFVLHAKGNHSCKTRMCSPSSIDHKGVSFPKLNPYSFPEQEKPSWRRCSQAHHDPIRDSLL